MGADLLEIAAPEKALVVCGRKSFQTDAKNVGRQTLGEQMSSGNRKKIVSRIIPKILQNKPVGRDEKSLQTFFH